MGKVTHLPLTTCPKAARCLLLTWNGQPLGHHCASLAEYLVLRHHLVHHTHLEGLCWWEEHPQLKGTFCCTVPNGVHKVVFEPGMKISFTSMLVGVGGYMLLSRV